MTPIIEDMIPADYVAAINGNYAEINSLLNGVLTLTQITVNHTTPELKVIFDANNVLINAVCTTPVVLPSMIVGQSGAAAMTAENSVATTLRAAVVTEMASDNITLTYDADDGDAPVIDLKGYVGDKVVSANWGDGNASFITMDGTLESVTNTYTDAGTYTVTIHGAGSIEEFSITTGDLVGFEADVTCFASATKMLKFHVGVVGGTWIGNTNGWNPLLKEYYLNVITNITGDLGIFSQIEIVFINSAHHGNIISSKMINLNINGNTTVDVDVTLMTNMIYMDSYANFSYAHGSVTGLTKLVQMCWGTPNHFTGVINSPDFEYLDNVGDSEMTGDITTMIKIWKFNSIGANNHNHFTGSITSNHTKLYVFNLSDYSTVTKPTRLINQPLISIFQNPKWSWTAAEVNQLLADLKTNKDSARDFPTFRYMNFSTGTSEAPTGQGIVDRDFLRLYHSPTPPGTADVWTILTN